MDKFRYLIKQYVYRFIEKNDYNFKYTNEVNKERCIYNQ